MKQKHFIILFALVIILSLSTTTRLNCLDEIKAKMDTHMKSWVGKSILELDKVYGKPDFYEKNNLKGYDALIYRYDRKYKDVEYEAWRIFWIDKKYKIRHWYWKGV